MVEVGAEGLVAQHSALISSAPQPLGVSAPRHSPEETQPLSPKHPQPPDPQPPNHSAPNKKRGSRNLSPEPLSTHHSAPTSQRPSALTSHPSALMGQPSILFSASSLSTDETIIRAQDAIASILASLRPHDLAKMSLVCKTLNTMASDERLWMTHCLADPLCKNTLATRSVGKMGGWRRFYASRAREARLARELFPGRDVTFADIWFYTGEILWENLIEPLWLPSEPLQIVKGKGM